jgi:hypothetical protein
MKPQTRERWTFTMELPAGVRHGGRFMARVLKHRSRPVKGRSRGRFHPDLRFTDRQRECRIAHRAPFSDDPAADRR